jgi:dGTPase
LSFSPAISAADRSIKAFLFPKLYHHPRLMSVRHDAVRVVRDLFGAFTSDPSQLPSDWRDDVSARDPARLARRAGDYIAGMTDRFALEEHRRLFPITPDLRIG